MHQDALKGNFDLQPALPQTKQNKQKKTLPYYSGTKCPHGSNQFPLNKIKYCPTVFSLFHSCENDVQLSDPTQVHTQTHTDRARSFS